MCEVPPPQAAKEEWPKRDIYALEDNAMLGAPLWSIDYDQRTRRWAAVISKDKQSPGGLNRQFLDYADGLERAYVVDGLKPGDVMEFAEDMGRGSYVERARYYGVVVAITDAEITLEQYPTSAKALRATQHNQWLFLHEAKELLQARLAVVDAEIQALRLSQPAPA